VKKKAVTSPRTPKPIAEQLGKSDVAIRVMLTRALKRLQSILSDETSKL
jgi:hypothetical protein